MTSMDDARLAMLEHENMIGALSLVGSTVDGAVVRRSDGVALVATGLPIRLFNQVLVDADGASPAAVAEAVQMLRARGQPFVVNLRIGADDDIIPITADLGLVPLSAHPWMPGMALHPLTMIDSGVASAGHEIRRVTDAAGLDDHIRAGAAGFEMPEALLRTIMAGSLQAGDDVAVYAAYDDGQPVASGLGVRTGRTIGVYNIATVPAARKRGFGAAMTIRIAADAAAAGCDVAVLQASEMGFAIYERLGYRTIVQYMAYVDPATRD